MHQCSCNSPFLLLFIGLFLNTCQAENKPFESGLIVDSTHVKRLQTFDADIGTMYVFFSNPGKQSVRIHKAFINGVPLSNQGEFLWYRIGPNPIPAMGMGELVVRLRKRPVSLSRPEEAVLRLVTGKGEQLFATIPLTPHPFHFTFIGYSGTLDTILLYMKNAGQTRLSLDKLFLSTKDITRNCRIPERHIQSNEKKLVVVELYEPLVRGQYIIVKATTKEGIIAQSRVRVFSDFPLDALDGSDSELFMDEADFDWKKSLENTDSIAYHILDCPVHGGNNHPMEEDYSVDVMPANAKTILSKIEKMQKLNPFLPGYVHVCRAGIYHGCVDFGQIADFIRINPSIALHPSYSRDIPDDIDETPVQYLTAFAKKASEPRPLHTSIAATSHADINTTPELERLLVYSAVSEGSKGIIYRIPGDSLQDRHELKQEIKRISGELQVLKRFLKIGEPMSLAECTHPDVSSTAILAGDKAVVLFLINKKFIESERAEEGSDTFASPIMNLEASVHIPKWMRIQAVYEVGGDFGHLKYTKRKNRIVIKVDRLDVTKQILLTTRADDYNYDQDKDGISDIDEILIHNTHPAIPNDYPTSKAATN